MAFRAGQKVMCVFVEGANGIWYPGEEPTKGAVYTITKIYHNPSGVLVLELAEIERCPECFESYGHMGYGAWRFRPVKTTSIEIFRQMLVNPPREVVDA